MTNPAAEQSIAACKAPRKSLQKPYRKFMRRTISILEILQWRVWFAVRISRYAD